MLIVFDFGRGIYIYNGMSEAAREIARTTIIRPYVLTGTTFGGSAAFSVRAGLQKNLVPGLQGTGHECLEFDGRAARAWRRLHQRRPGEGHRRRDVHPDLPAGTDRAHPLTATSALQIP